MMNMKLLEVVTPTSIDQKPCINRRSKSLQLTIDLYRYYDEHDAPRSCNTTVYLSVSMDTFYIDPNVLELSVKAMICISVPNCWMVR